jgi:hypothetical protein
MEQPVVKRPMRAAEIEALIIDRLRVHPHCAPIMGVKVAPTGVCPPGPSWTITQIERPVGAPINTPADVWFFIVVSELRGEIDLTETISTADTCAEVLRP